jgi:hypothetical protein
MGKTSPRIIGTPRRSHDADVTADASWLEMTASADDTSVSMASNISSRCGARRRTKR